MEHNQNRIAAINRQRAMRIKFHDHSWLSISRRKNWPLSTGYFGSWGYASVAVAVVETLRQDLLYRLSLEGQKIVTVVEKWPIMEVRL